VVYILDEKAFGTFYIFCSQKEVGRKIQRVDTKLLKISLQTLLFWEDLSLKNNKGSLPNHKNANKMFVRIFMKVLFNKF
jgi:hypothetical protein